MSSDSRIKHKIGIFFASVIVVLVSPYAALYILLDSRLSPLSYQHYLINKFHGQQKLLIISGSNSEYGIWAPKLEEELKIPTINMSFNFNYPLEYRIYYAKAYTKPGDIIILPLEYVFYQKENLYPLTYGSLMSSSASKVIPAHFKTLPFYLKVKLLFQYDFPSVKLLLMSHSEKKALLKKYDYDFNHGHRGNIKLGMPRLNPEEDELYFKTHYPLFFEEHLFIFQKIDTTTRTRFIDGRNAVGAQFKKELELLKKLQAKGVIIIFTDPVMISLRPDRWPEKTATEYDEVQQKYNEIVEYVRANDFIFLENIEGSIFQREDMVDSSFHLNIYGMEKRTASIIELIRPYLEGAQKNYVNEKRDP